MKERKNNKLPAILLLTIFCCIRLVGTSQSNMSPANITFKVGIFAPIYLDSVFSASGNFKYKESIPKFITPGLEFVHGAQIALDSMMFFDEQVEAYIYDTKSYTHPIPQLIKSNKLDSLDLIIGSVKDIDYKQLSDFALSKNIPFVSATYPNDGGVVANPFLIIANSTLKAHCEAIYSYIIQTHGADKIYLCRKKGNQEDKIANYFNTMNDQDGKAFLNIQKINFDSSFTYETLKKKLDTTRKIVIIGGSLEENFATDLADACKEFNDHYNNVTLVGMPNWDGFKALLKKEDFEDFPIYYTTPYFNNKSDAYSKIVINGYNKKYKGKPSDMAFKGFEITYSFVKLLIKYPNDLMNHLNDKTFKLFTDYNFRPVILKKEGILPDYFENKHLYFIKILNGSMTKAW